MKTFKLIDCWMQVVLIIGSLFAAFFLNEFFLGYLVVGGWQLTSCLTHFIFKTQYFPSRNRGYYLKTLFWLLVLCILSIPFIWIASGFVLLFISPGLAVWYAFICYTENEVLQHKAYAHIR